MHDTKKIVFRILVLVGLLFSSTGFSQEVSDDFELFATIDAPKDLKWGLAGGVLLDADKNLMIISYDYNPTYLDFYRVSDMKFLKRVIIKGFVYLDNSYFYLKENAVYIDRGRNKNNYIKIDLDSYSQVKVSCDAVPKGCPYEKIVNAKTYYYKETNLTIIINDWYILRFDHNKTEVFLKKETP